MKSRVYPSYLPFAQATGRWSVIDPPMSTLPYDYRSMYVPDEDECWICFDWSAIEARIFAALANDEVLLDAFLKDYDVHTINVVDLFDWSYPTDLVNPHGDNRWCETYSWLGKDDPRRVYAKSFLYGLIYGMDPHNAHSLPGSDRLGVPKESLADKAKLWIKKHPAVTKYRNATERQVINYGYNTSAYGRRRYFLEYNVHRKIKQALDNPMQATAADIMNHTIIELWDLTCDVGGGLVYPMHDSIKWRLPTIHMDSYLQDIQELVTQPRELNGITMRFPADFEVLYGQN